MPSSWDCSLKLFWRKAGWFSILRFVLYLLAQQPVVAERFEEILLLADSL